MMFYKNIKVMVHSSHGEMDLFDICHRSFARRYISTIFVYDMPRLHISNADRSNKRKLLYTKKRNKQTIYCRNFNITNADYADDLELLANTPAQVESLLHSLE